MRRYSQTLRRVIPEFWTHFAPISQFLRILAETTPPEGGFGVRRGRVGRIGFWSRRIHCNICRPDHFMMVGKPNSRISSEIWLQHFCRGLKTGQLWAVFSPVLPCAVGAHARFGRVRGTRAGKICPAFPPPERGEFQDFVAGCLRRIVGGRWAARRA